MNTAVALKESHDIAITTEQLAIIKTTICREATDAEMQLYFYDCKRRGVHPLDRLIHFTKRGGRYVPITSIDFIYQRAHATEQFAGQDETVFKGQPGSSGFEATVRVYRQRPGGEKSGWSATARWAEYFPGDQQGHMWRKMPTRMLEKCAEALALRKAFPTELQGLYVKEELDQAGPELTSPTQATPHAPDKGSAVLDKMKKNGHGHRPSHQPESRPPEPPQEDVVELGPPASEEPAPAPTLTAANVCQQFRLCESVAELSSIMNQWLHEEQSAEDKQQVVKVFEETKQRLGKRR